MNRARYPKSSDPTVVAAQRGAALSKTIVAVAIVGGILAVATLAARDAPHPPSPQAHSDVSAPAAASPALPEAPATASGQTRDADEPMWLDPREIDDYGNKVHG